MRRTAALAFSLTFAAARVCSAADAVGTSDDALRTTARPGLIVGLSLDVAGFLGVVIASGIAAGAEDDSGRGPLVGACASGGAVVLGSLVLDASFTVRYAAYRRAGLATRPNLLVLGWIFTAATAALYAGSVVGWERNVKREDDPWAAIGGAFTSVFAFGAALAVEAVNLAVFRLLFRRDLSRSLSSRAPAVALAPLVAPAHDGRPRPALGLAVVAAF
jgi:hypothetical protein